MMSDTNDFILASFVVPVFTRLHRGDVIEIHDTIHLHNLARHRSLSVTISDAYKQDAHFVSSLEKISYGGDRGRTSIFQEVRLT